MTTTQDHIYHRIADALRNGEAGEYTFKQVEAACEHARQDGIAIQTYGDPVAMATMLKACGYLDTEVVA